MPTSATGAEGYADAGDFVARYDVRTAGDLLSDTGTRLAAGAVADSGVLATLLAGASGEVESATLVGDRYAITATRNDLADLGGNSLAYLKDVVCALAADRLFSRRPDLYAQVGDRVKAARDALQALRDGHRVFGWLEQARAGQGHAAGGRQRDDDERGGINVQAERLWGTRGWRRRQP